MYVYIYIYICIFISNLYNLYEFCTGLCRQPVQLVQPVRIQYNFAQTTCTTCTNFVQACAANLYNLYNLYELCTGLRRQPVQPVQPVHISYRFCTGSSRHEPVQNWYRSYRLYRFCAQTCTELVQVVQVVQALYEILYIIRTGCTGYIYMYTHM